VSDYFLISVATAQHLRLCLRHRVAGFSNSINGLWAYLDIEVGDYVTFLHGARLYNLYQVYAKVAHEHADTLGPWEPITWRSKRTYYFPFRLYLQPVRTFVEPLVRPEFAFVGDHLFLRGGYRKTHFQSDQAMLSWALQAGRPAQEPRPSIPRTPTFEPKIVLRRHEAVPPYRYHLQENILQALLRRKIRAHLSEIQRAFNMAGSPQAYEILGETALAEGFVDLLLKPLAKGKAKNWVLIEVKAGRVTRRDFEQLARYLRQVPDAAGGMLIGRAFPRQISPWADKPLLAWRYDFTLPATRGTGYTFDAMRRALRLTRVR